LNAKLTSGGRTDAPSVGGAARQQDGTQDGTQGLDKQRQEAQAHTPELDRPEALLQPVRDRPGQSVYAMDSRMHQQTSKEQSTSNSNGSEQLLSQHGQVLI